MGASLIGAISTIVGAAFFIDGRYAHAGDVAAMHQEQIQAINETKMETKRAADQLRKQNLEDKIFEINLKPVAGRSNVDRALLDRYTREVRELSEKWK